jgi:hypothetical protein
MRGAQAAGKAAINRQNAGRIDAIRLAKVLYVKIFLRALHALLRARSLDGTWYARPMTTCKKWALIGCFLLAACNKSQASPLRSPALDYQPPAPESDADNQPIGADRVAPSDKLEQGITTQKAAPGWDANKSGVTYDPKRRVGGAIDPPPEPTPPQK